MEQRTRVSDAAGGGGEVRATMSSRNWGLAGNYLVGERVVAADHRSRSCDEVEGRVALTGHAGLDLGRVGGFSRGSASLDCAGC